MRIWHWIAALLIAGGYWIAPSDMVWEWTLVAVSFLVGLALPFLANTPITWRDLRALAAAGVFFAVAGLVVRITMNDLALTDALLLIRSQPIWGFLQPVGYWLLAGTLGVSLGVIASAHATSHVFGGKPKR